LATLESDVEALLIRAAGPDGDAYECFLVPVDKCYELVGQLRRVWRGFDGGEEARRHIDDFFSDLRARSRMAPAERVAASEPVGP
jgi:hypothetical protein